MPPSARKRQERENDHPASPEYRHLDEHGKWVGKFDPSLWYFEHRMLVRCEKCRKRAIAKTKAYDEEKQLWIVGCVCSYCAHVWAVRSKRPNLADLPLWLQAPCCGEKLWALNEEHLAYLEMHLGARVRKRAHGQNSTIAARLPRWMSAAKNRKAIMKGLSRLREILADS